MSPTINSNNIEEYLTKGENNTLEYKVSINSYDSICKTIAGFANTNGGIIIIGYNESTHNISSYDNNYLEKINNLYLYFDNPPEYITYTITYKNKKLLIIEVKKNIEHLTFFKGTLLFRQNDIIKPMSAQDIQKHYKNNCTTQTLTELSNSISKMNQSIILLTTEVNEYKTELAKADRKNIIIGFIFCILGVILGNVLQK